MPPNTSGNAFLPLALAHLRTATGLGFIFLPSFTLRQFLLPNSTNNTAITAFRFAGVRELVVAQTLLFAVRNWRRGSLRGASEGHGVHEGTGLLAGEDGRMDAAKSQTEWPMKEIEAERERQRIVACALLAGAVVDGLDVLVCALGYWEGTVPGDAALLTGCFGSVASLAGLGVLVGGGWRL